MIKKHQLLLTAIFFILLGLSLIVSSGSFSGSTADNTAQQYEVMYNR